MTKHLLPLLLVVSTTFSATMASPSVGAWFAGFDQSDYETDEGSNVMSRVQHCGTALARRSPLLQVPCGIILTDQPEDYHHQHPHDQEKVHPVQAYCDTGVAETTITYRAAQKVGLLPLISYNPLGGRIEAGKMAPHRGASLWLRLGSARATVAAPAIVILPRDDDDELPSSRTTASSEQQQELVLGLDFLRQVHAIVDLRNEELQIMIDDDEQQGEEYHHHLHHQEDVMVPLIRPRAGLNLN